MLETQSFLLAFSVIQAGRDITKCHLVMSHPALGQEQINTKSGK